MKKEENAMLYDQMFSMANDMAVKQQQYGGFSPQDTICVLCSGSGRYYVGVSSGNMHAEINAMNQMMSSGENIVTGLLLVNAYNLGAMLPCGGCVQYILSQNPANTNAQIVLPDRQMSVMEISGPGVGAPTVPNNRAVAAPDAVTKSSSDLLKSRVGSLMDIDDDDDDEEEESKGFFGKLFGGKK